MNKKISFISVLSLIACALFSQQKEMLMPSHTAIDGIAKRLMEAAGVTGLCVGTVTHGEVDYVNSYGFKNKAVHALNDTATSFYAASLAKPVFAYIVMQLAEQGVIDLDKPLYGYLPKPLPEYRHYSDLSGDDRWKLITARECLNHTTGFPNWRQLNPNGSRKLQIFFSPGTRYAYSGEGLYLLQFVVETITGQTLEELAQKQVFKPFGMTKTAFIWQSHFDADYATGHNRDEDTLAIKKRTEANAAGSMQMTIADYTRFMSCILQGRGLSEQSRQDMLTPQISIDTKHQFPSLNNEVTDQYRNIQLSYGLGWGLFTSARGRAFFKEGHSEDGWEHYTIAFPDRKDALVVMTNSLNGESIFKELVEAITGAVIPWEWEGYIPYQPVIKMSKEQLEQYVGDYSGKVRATILLENGQLKIESPSEDLARTTLYPATQTHFFLKSMDLNIEFLPQPDGQPRSIKVYDEGEVYELRKADNAAATRTGVMPSANLLSAYAGRYRLSDNPDRTLQVKPQKDGLYIIVPGQGPMQPLFTSDTTFQVKSILDIKGEFITTDGTVRLVIYQQGRYEWKKTN